MTRAARFFCFLLLIFAAGGAAAGPVELVSRIHPSETFDTGSGAIAGSDFEGDFNFPAHPSLSADGRYLAFVSTETNLVPGQQDAEGAGDFGSPNVFLRDLLTGDTRLVSRSVVSATTAGNNGSGRFGAVISADGRWIAYFSEATDLVPGQRVSDYGDTHYVILYDVAAETATVAAASFDDLDSFDRLAISADGRYLTFTTRNSDLIPGQPYNLDPSVFFYDRAARELRLVDHKRGFPNLPVDGYSSGLGISADGRYVLYTSSASDLVAGQRDNDRAFLYDRTSGTSIAVGSTGNPVARAVLSSDGKWVLGMGDPNVAYLRSRETGVTTSFSGMTASEIYALSSDGRYALFSRRDDDYSVTLMIYDRAARSYAAVPKPAGLTHQIGGAWLSGDGRYVLFLDAEKNVVPGQVDRNANWDLFLFDRTTGKTSLVSRSAASGASPATTANAPSFSPAISANGSRVAFSSMATDLVADATDLNGGFDVFSYAVSTATPSLVTRHASGLPSLSPEARSTARALSADGRWVAFESQATRLVAGQVDANGRTDLFLYDRTARQTTLVSRTAVSPVTTGNGVSLQPSISADGRYVSFLSTATDLAAGAAASADFLNLYVFDRVAGSTRWVGRTESFSSSSGDPRSEHRISADGNWVTFTSVADDLVAGQHQNTYGFNLFLWSQETGNVTLITRSALYADLWTAYGQSGAPAISADGRYVAFRSTANDLIPGQTAAGPASSETANVFLYDRGTGAIALVSHKPASPVAGSSADSPPALSADGRFVAFASWEADLDPAVSAVDHSTYLYDRTLGTNQWIAHDARGYPQISADGGTVAFLSQYPLVSGIVGGTLQLYLWDRGTKTFTLATPSRKPGGTGGKGVTYDFALSASGRYVAFIGGSDDLIAGQIPPPASLQNPRDLYLFDRVTGGTVLVSRSKSSPLARTGEARLPLISADGHRVAFTSSSSLEDGDLNRREDAYLFNLDSSAPGGPVTVPPCTLFNGAAQRSNARKVLAVVGSCGVPAGASRVTVKVTALQGTAAGNLRLYPGNVTAPASGTLRFVKTKTASATFDLPLATNGAGTIAILPFVRGNGTVRVVVEVDGYTR